MTNKHLTDLLDSIQAQAARIAREAGDAYVEARNARL